MTTTNLRSGTGVVTFLDVLGWKGVYDRNPKAISSLMGLVEGLRTRAEEQRGKVQGDTLVKSISDTIAIFTSCTDEEAPIAIDIHGRLCQWVIPQSIDAEIPVRGAIAYGEFDIRENIFVGKAVDEAASWHEHADWIGVHLTPSAEYILQTPKSLGVWVFHSPPNKTKLAWKPPCVNWTMDWGNRDAKVLWLKDKFRTLGPILPEIAAKFSNTLAFVEAAKPSVPKAEGLAVHKRESADGAVLKRDEGPSESDITKPKVRL